MWKPAAEGVDIDKSLNPDSPALCCGAGVGLPPKPRRSSRPEDMAGCETG